MSTCKKDHYKWISLIKSDNIKDVISEIKGNKLDAVKSLDCLVAIGHLAYEQVKNGKEFKSLPEHIIELTKWLSSLYCLEPSKHTLKYLTSIYHILHFLLKKNHLDYLVSLYKTVVKFKLMNLKSFEDDAEKLHYPFVYILKEAVVKVISVEVDPINLSLLTTLFSLFVELGTELKKVSGEKALLESLLQAAQLLSKKENKEIMAILNAGFNVLYTSKNAKDLGTSLALLFKTLTYLYCAQKKISNHHSSLAAVKSHLDNAKWKCSGNVCQAECFLLACNSVTIFMGDCPENIMLKKIQENSDILKTFLNSQNDELIIATCDFVTFMVVFAHANDSKSTPIVPESCLESFVLMLLDFCTVLQDSPSHQLDVIHALTEIFNLLSINTCDKQVLKRCIVLVLKIEKCIERNLNELKTRSHPNLDIITLKILARFANLIRTYHMEDMSEEVITIAKPICKFICTLPSDVFEIPHNVKSLELCFLCLVSALSCQQVGQALDCLMVWVSLCPQSSLQVFKIWGDLKHNTVCSGKDDHLETNVWTVVNGRKSDLEREWCPINPSEAEVGDFLILELQTYFGNRALRGKPVISAANALLALNVDCLTKVKGLVIAMDIATANPDFAELCTTYYNKSKQLATKLRREKKNLHPVAFNCCMGDLLYAQLQCQLKYLRSKCENEMVKLSKSPVKPLVTELPENQPDPNDTCDITTRYHHLCLDQQRKLMDVMDSAIRHWGFACGMLKDASTAKLDLKVTMTSLQGAGYLLKLYCDEYKEIKVWNILYDMALIVGDINMSVWAFSQLMTTNSNISPEMISKVKAMMLNNSDLNETTTLSYELSLAFSTLKKNKIAEGLVSLKTFEKAEKKNRAQLPQFYSIIGQFQSRPDWKNYNHSFDSCPSFHFSLHLCFRRLLFYVIEKNWASFRELCQQQNELLVVSYLLGEANWALEQPREARAYLKTIFPLTQQLALPLRTVQLLLLLAWIDLNTGLMDDCAVKLEGLEDLLELCGTPVVYGRSLGSPSVNKSTLHVPDYLSHPPACQCLPCTTVEYRRLVLETLTLRASFCAAFGTPADAAQSFQVAKLVEEELSKTDVREVYKSCATFWLRYADFKASLGEQHEAITANERASQLLSFVQDPLRLQQADQQKIGLQCVFGLLQFNIASTRAKVVIEAKKTVPSKFSTPVSQKSKAPENSPLATINSNIKPITPFARPVRPFRIPSSGAENTPVSASKVKRKTKMPPKFVCETPQNLYKIGKDSTVKSFVIVDDDGMAVGMSGTKISSHTRNTKKKIPDMEGDLQQTKNCYKKKLFSSTNKTDVKSDFSNQTKDSEEPLITRMTKKSEPKTYGNSKLSSKKTTSHLTNKSETTKQNGDRSKVGLNGDVFSFCEMKNSISDIDNSKSKYKTGVQSNKSTTSLQSKRQAVKSISSQLTKTKADSNKTTDIKSEKKFSIDSNCDLIEGTPPPECQKQSVSLIPKRITRSTKA